MRDWWKLSWPSWTFLPIIGNQPARLLVMSLDIVNEYSDFYFACGISISSMKVSISSSIFLNILYPYPSSSHFAGCPCNIFELRRATQEVTSPELRRVLPGEAVTQRDLTETLPNGLVRMPVLWPRHWMMEESQPVTLSGWPGLPRVCNWWQLGASCLTFPRWSRMDGSQYMCLGGVIWYDVVVLRIIVSFIFFQLLT